MVDIWDELRLNARAVLERGVLFEEDIERFCAQLEPCWVSRFDFSARAQEGKPPVPLPDVGVSKLGGWPDMAAGMEWPRTTGDATMDFVAQVRLADGPALSGFPEDGLLLFFSGGGGGGDADPPNRDLEHAVLLVEEGQTLAPVERPACERFVYSKNYSPMPSRWKPSLCLVRVHGFDDYVDCTDELADKHDLSYLFISQVQQKLDEELTGFAAGAPDASNRWCRLPELGWSRFGGRMLDHRGDDTMRIVDELADWRQVLSVNVDFSGFREFLAHEDSISDLDFSGYHGTWDAHLH